MGKVFGTALFLLIFFVNALYAQESTKTYGEYWRMVHKYELHTLTKSAANVVDTIYNLAEQENNDQQLIKALIYQSKFMLVLEEDAQLKVVNQFRKAIAQSVFPRKNVLENILAQIYWQYFKQNRWRFYNRTHTQEKVDSIDFRTWDLKMLFIEIHQHFKNSLQQASLSQKTDLNDFNQILIQKEGSKAYRPTLFDFLAHNALEFYKTGETSITRPAYKFEIDDTIYFESFSEVDLETNDSLSLQYQALVLYEQLLRFHAKDEDPTAFVTVALERLAFVKDNTTLNNVQAHYLEALRRLKGLYKEFPVSAAINFEIATLYNEQADEYQPKIDTTHRFKRKAALQICEQAIARYPESKGAENCALLKKNILSKSLSIVAEKYLPIGLPSRLLVEYKNVDSLYFKIYKAEEEQFYQIDNDSAKIAFVNSLPVEREWKVALRNEHDYQTHTTEVLMPELPQGSYMIFASPSEKVEHLGVYGFSFIQVSDLALVKSNIVEQYRYQVVDRTTGKPIAEAKVRLSNKHSTHSEKRFNKSFTTDKEGFIQFRNNSYYNNIKATVTAKNDQAIFGNYYLYHFGWTINPHEDRVFVKPFLFTDRSIYRPGQTVYFKGILIKKQGEQSDIVASEYVEVYLEDVNGQEVASLRLRTNEFGSFSGEFILPSGGLTGEYTIYVEEDFEEYSKRYDDLMEEFEWFEHTISVEEYKRPKFETQFDPVKQAYQVNDTITVNGTAKAFAGSNITNAKVTYRVQRKVQYPGWFYWNRPYGSYASSQEIIHGETTTDARGAFSIDFKAIPDLNVAKENLPVFSYEITADVTDINGETRSATTVVKVGYHTLLATAEIPSKIAKEDKGTKISLSTQNLNGEFMPTKGTLKIYKLQAPQYVLRERPWHAPDYQKFSKEEFKALFPHDPYENEDDPQNWKKGKLVFETTFDTELSKEIELHDIKDWANGNYFMVLECEDDFGLPVMDKQKFQVYSRKGKKLADNTLFSITTNKNSYKIGEKVKLKIGSASRNLTATISIEKGHKIVKTHLVHLKDNVKVVEIPVNMQDVGGFAIQYSFANFNAFESGTLSISVPRQSEEIEIETITFRDKLQPGGKETWSFKIKGGESDLMVAEMLASMYDASLDEFKSHTWHFNPIEYRRYYSQFNIEAFKSFENTHFNVRNLFRSHYSAYSRQQYDELDWFGFNLAQNRYVNSQYLRRIAANTYFSSTNSTADKSRKKGFIYGRITDDSGEPLPGANILIQGTDQGTIADIDGYYSLKAEKGDKLIFNFIGYQTTYATVGEDNIIDVVLVPDIQSLEEVVVVGYGSQEKRLMTGAVAEVADEVSLDMEILQGKVPGVMVTGGDAIPEEIRIRGVSTLGNSNSPLYIVDGVIVNQFELNPNDVLSVETLKGSTATAIYGAKAANGAVIITTKAGQAALDAQLAQVKVRKNLQETAFFFPHLTTDKEGNVSFNFTAPEALTRWKLQLLAHTKTLATSSKTLYTVTQKDLMVIPNPPRFLRQGDEIVFSSKIANLTADTLNGFAVLQLFDAITGKPIDEKLGNKTKNQSFQVDAKGNTQVSWHLKIPEDIQAVQYKVIAKAGDFSDGEQNVLPVLSNRMLVTETLPMWIRSSQTKTFTLGKLKNNGSESLRHHQLTLEMTSNPAWYAVQALPYLMEYPYECAEQTFARYYANALASHILNAHPRVREVFDQWSATDGLKSNLEKNEALKSIIIQETPWLRDAQSETEQKKRIALLFDLNKMNNELTATIHKLKEMQMNNGGFPWFKGSRYPNRYITQHIASGYGHLKHLDVAADKDMDKLIEKALKHLDKEMLEDYDRLLKQALKIKEKAKNKEGGIKKEKEYLKANHLSPIQIHYLYMRSFYPSLPIPKEVQPAVDYYRNQSVTYWKEQSLYMKGMIALVQHRNGDKETSITILKSLKENSITSDELGMYWKANKPSWRWNQAPIETQALLIEAFSEIEIPGLSAEAQTQTVDELRIWLLKHKQTNQWPSTKSTTEAIYALLLQGSDWISVTDMVEITVGNQKIDPSKLEAVKVEAGTGYFKTSWHGNEITPDMGTVKITKQGKGIAWGGLYWQYFEDLDKITSAETPLQLSKKLFLTKNTDTGETLFPIDAETPLHLGDLVRVRIELKVDREMDFVHMKDLRASGLAPVNVLSEYKWQDGLGYYESTKDASTNFFFERLPKGVYVFEYDLRVNNKGDFSNGITTIQSMYAPEFSSHSEGVRILVE